MSSVAHMLADPCDGPLVPYAASGGGYVTRFKRTIKLHQTSADNNGYIVWFPDFHSTSGPGNPANLVYYESAVSSAAPTNSVPGPFGSGVPGAGQFTQDPCYSWVSSVTCQEARTLAACLRLRYSGKLADTTGTIAVVKEVSASQLFNGSGTVNVPASVDNLMTFAPEVERFNPEGVEVRYRPHDDTSVPRSTGLSVNSQGDRVFLCGTAGTSATTLPAGDVSTADKRGIGIVWTGLNTGAAVDVWVDLIKIVEWTPNTSVGIVESPPVTSVDSNVFGRALSFLDKNIPNWQTLSSATPSALTRSRDMLLAGNTAPRHHSKNFFESAFRGTERALNSRMGRMALEAAPLLLSL